MNRNLEKRLDRLEAKAGNKVAVLNMCRYRGLTVEEAKARHLEEHPEDAHAGIWIIVRDLTD